jgi:phosphoribosylaminoimidazolecarboxamide formyltransferase/IMP cyclohydrolase
MEEATDKTPRVALISVYDKSGIEKVGKFLETNHFRILSTGGTLKYLHDHDISAQDVAEITGFPSIMDGRLKTIHPAVHGGMLAIKDNPDHLADLERVGGFVIDLVYIDLYPLEAEIAREGSTPESITEQTDIGGPAMLRSAAKGRRIVICDRNDDELLFNWPTMPEEEQQRAIIELAAKAEARVAQYAGTSAKTISGGAYLSQVWDVPAGVQPAYAENRWMGEAKLLRPFRVNTQDQPMLSISNFERIGGAAPGFVNITDADSALGLLAQISTSYWDNFQKEVGIAIAVKHGNPCGVGVDQNIEKAVKKMIEGDPEAIHGATIVLNFAVDRSIASLLRYYGIGQQRGSKMKSRLIDGIWAAEFSEDAGDILDRKSGKCRMMQNPELQSAFLGVDQTPRLRQLRNGEALMQGAYDNVLSLQDERLKLVGKPLTGTQQRDVVIAAAICSWTVSNTIALVKNGMLLGVGAGQTSRKRACALAVQIAWESKHDSKLRGAVAASDSFFPFPDGPERLISNGIKVIYATSGSVNDDQVEAVCSRRNIKLLWGPDKDFRMFSRH